jgi:NitT/TauT family transport system substrate-binding protein
MRGWVAWLLFFLAACGPSGGPERVQAPIELKVGIRPYLLSAPLFIAEEEGYFSEQGLRVEFVQLPGTSTSQSLPVLARGKIDAIVGSVNVGLLNTLASGAPIRSVADVSHLERGRCNHLALVARRTLTERGELARPDQLRNRRIAINPMSHWGYLIEVLLEEGGLSLEDVQVVTVPLPAMVQGLNEGAIDLAATSEPWVTHMRRAGHMPAPLGDLPEFQISTLLYGPTLLRENRDAGRRLMRAYLKGVRQYREGKTPRNLEIVSRRTGLDSALLREACWPSVRKDGRVDTGSVLAFQSWAIRKGWLSSSVGEQAFWDPEFIEQAGRTLAAAGEATDEAEEVKP